MDLNIIFAYLYWFSKFFLIEKADIVSILQMTVVSNEKYIYKRTFNAYIFKMRRLFILITYYCST